MKLNTNAGASTNRSIEKRQYHPRPVEADFNWHYIGSGRPRLNPPVNQPTFINGTVPYLQ